MWWGVVVLLASTSPPPPVNAEMLLDYEHPDPNTLPWAERNTGRKTLDPQVAQVRLAMMVVETARNLLSKHSYTRPHTHTQDKELKGEVKSAVYRKVLLQTLNHSQKAHKQLVDTIGSNGMKESILRQWLEFLTGSDMVHRVLYSLKDQPATSTRSKRPDGMRRPNQDKERAEGEDEPLDDDGPHLTHSHMKPTSAKRKSEDQDLFSLLMGTLREISRPANRTSQR